MNNSIKARKNMTAAASVGGDIEKYEEKYFKCFVFFFSFP